MSITNQEQAGSWVKPSLFWGIVGLAAALFAWFNWQYVVSFLTFVGNRTAVTDYLQSFGIWGPLLLVSILSLQVVIAVIPGHILIIASGYLYGFGPGLAYNLLGTVVASQIAFVVIRYVGQPVVNRLVPANLLERWNRAAQHQGFIFFLFFFWFPVVPSNVMNFVAALSPISFWAFLAANVLGRLPGVVLVRLIGSHGVQLSWRQWVFLAGLGLLLLIGGRLIANKLQQHYFQTEGKTN